MRIACYSFLAIGLFAFVAAFARADEDVVSDTIKTPETEIASEEAPAIEETTVTEEKTTAKEKTARPQTFAGRGRQASGKFTLEKGLTVFSTTFKGEGNYIVSLVNSEGEEIQNLFNQIGSFEGARGFEIKEAGDYLLNVQATGDWNFSIEQPRPTTGQNLPTALKGSRTEVTPFLALKKGLAVFKMTYKGDGRFAATLTDQNGRPVEYLVNTLRSFQGSAPIKVPNDGIYFINVSAEGDWQVEIQ